MTTTDYAQTILEVRKDAPSSPTFDEATVYAAAQLITGSFILPLYGELWKTFFDMDGITDHLESLYDSDNHHGLVYFVFILANAIELTVPIEFTEMSAKDRLVPILSAAIIEDWLEYDGSFEPTEYTG